MKRYRVLIRQLVPEFKWVEVEAESGDEARRAVRESIDFRDGDGFEYDNYSGIVERYVDDVEELP